MEKGVACITVSSHDVNHSITGTWCAPSPHQDLLRVRNAGGGGGSVFEWHGRTVGVELGGARPLLNLAGIAVPVGQAPWVALSRVQFDEYSEDTTSDKGTLPFGAASVKVELYSEGGNKDPRGPVEQNQMGTKPNPFGAVIHTARRPGPDLVSTSMPFLYSLDYDPTYRVPIWTPHELE